jgi:hypothetical protein
MEKEDIVSNETLENYMQELLGPPKKKSFNIKPHKEVVFEPRHTGTEIYWRRIRLFDRIHLRRVVRDFKTVYNGNKDKIPLAYPDGTGKPDINLQEGLRFNGKNDEMGERFFLVRRHLGIRNTDEEDRYYDTCDHKGMPYNIYVKVALILAKFHLKEGIKIWSDEGIEGWFEAYDLLCEHLPYVCKWITEVDENDKPIYKVIVEYEW